MKRYAWLDQQVQTVPRKKFFVFEPVEGSVLARIEIQYGRLPSDFREFVRDYGKAKLFRSKFNSGYSLLVWAPPLVSGPVPTPRRGGRDVVRLALGYYANGGDAWLEWADGEFPEGGRIFIGFPG